MKTVHEVSKITGLTIRTLRHYDDIGLLKVQRTGEGISNDRKKRKKAEKMGCTFSCSSDVTDGLRQHRINGKQHIVRVGHFGSFSEQHIHSIRSRCFRKPDGEHIRLGKYG